MKKNTNWKGGGHNGTSIYCCLIMAAGTVRTHKKANWHLVVHSHTPWIMKQNTTNHTTNTFYKTPNRSIKYFRILRLLQQLLQLNPYIDKTFDPLHVWQSNVYYRFTLAQAFPHLTAGRHLFTRSQCSNIFTGIMFTSYVLYLQRYFYFMALGY